MTSDYLTDLRLGDYKKVNSGKVREIFDIGEYLLLVATDRISAFDVVLPDAIPKKGAVLTQMSKFWFDRVEEAGITGHHLVSADVNDFPEGLKSFRAELAGRASLVKKCEIGRAHV